MPTAVRASPPMWTRGAARSVSGAVPKAAPCAAGSGERPARAARRSSPPRRLVPLRQLRAILVMRTATGLCAPPLVPRPAGAPSPPADQPRADTFPAALRRRARPGWPPVRFCKHHADGAAARRCGNQHHQPPQRPPPSSSPPLLLITRAITTTALTVVVRERRGAVGSARGGVSALRRARGGPGRRAGEGRAPRERGERGEG